MLAASRPPAVHLASSVALLLSAACGTPPLPDATTVCTTLSPKHCTDDPVGIWTLYAVCGGGQEACDTGGGTYRLDVDPNTIDLTLRFNSDGQFTASGAIGGYVARATYPPVCLGKRPDLYCTDYLGLRGSGARCALTSDGGCECDYPVATLVDEGAPFATMDGHLLLGGLDPMGSGAPTFADVCVDGDLLWFDGHSPLLGKLGFPALPAPTTTVALVFARATIETPPERHVSLFGLDLAAPPDLAPPVDAGADAPDLSVELCGGFGGGTNCPSGEVCDVNQLPSICVPGCDLHANSAPCPGGRAYACCDAQNPVEPWIGVCADIDNDVDNCGACGSACSTVHGVPSCQGGFCSIACENGCADCDKEVANGCETAISDGGACP